jgi:D-amino peptidase
MKLFISVDMEGSTGLERLEEIFRGLPGFDTFRQIMAGDCNAVIQGAIEAGASEIVVSDSHGYMCNMRPDDLIRGVQLRRGQMTRQWCQMKTFDGSFDAAILIGYHAKAGTNDGILAHTWIPGFRDVRVNGHSVPEPSLNAHLAGAFGVPVVMLSGDNYVIEQSRPVLGDIEYAQLKKSTGFFSGEHLPIDRSRALLRAAAKRAVAGARRVQPVACDPALGARPDDNVRYIDQAWTEVSRTLSDVDLVLRTHPEVTSPRLGTVAFTCRDYQTAYRTLHSILLEIYERDIENLIDDVAHPGDYTRPDLADIISDDYPLNEIGPQPTG